MDIDSLLVQLLEIAQVPVLQNRTTVERLADVYRDRLFSFASNLSMDDRIAFVKSIATVEHSIGGFGSVTNLQFLLPLIPDLNRTLLDWLLRNTDNWWLFRSRARSIEEFDLIEKQRAEEAAARAPWERERQRQLADRIDQDKIRIAEKATDNLFNAVRRGDTKAVRALIEKGADVSTACPDGSSLTDFARSRGFEAIVTELLDAGLK